MEKDQQPVTRKGLRTPAQAWNLASRLPYDDATCPRPTIYRPHAAGRIGIAAQPAPPADD